MTTSARTVENDDLRIMLLSTFRYSLGRMTYMPGWSRDLIREHGDVLSKHDFAQLAEEIDDRVRIHGSEAALGSADDGKEWRRFQEWCREQTKETA